jgi:undecaprenyl-diphosphatase
LNDLNQTIFLYLNASEQANTTWVFIAKLLADYAILVVPLLLVLGWVKGTLASRKLMLEATASALLGLFIAQLIGLVWPHPRPFMIGMGHTLIAHAADSSFPSDHLVVLWAVASSFMLRGRLRVAGLSLALFGLPIAWARIYLGVHFPFDMLGAAIVGAISAWVCFFARGWYVPPTLSLFTSIYSVVFANLIRRGWVRP